MVGFLLCFELSSVCSKGINKNNIGRKVARFMQSILSFITGIDSHVWYMAAAIVFAICIIKVIIKGFKGVIFIVLVAVILVGLGGLRNYTENSLGISYTHGKLVVESSDGGKIEFDPLKINSVKVHRNTNDKSIVISIKEGDKLADINVSSSMHKIAEEILNKLPLKVNIVDE